MESLQQYGYRRQLDDILEDDEEASGYHTPRSLPTTEQLLDCFQSVTTSGNLQQPLSILSLDKVSASTSGKSASENVCFPPLLFMLFRFFRIFKKTTFSGFPVVLPTVY